MFQEFRSSKSVQVFFAIAMIFSAVGIFLLDNYRYQDERNGIQKIAVAYAYHIRTSVYQALSATYPLAALIRANNGNMEDFDQLAEEMLRYYPGIDSLQLAPNGIVAHIVPLKGNEKAIGHNLLADPNRNKEAFLSKQTGQLTLAGPFNLLQGGIGAAGRLPIYLQSRDGMEPFWGFATVMIRIPEIFHAINLAVLEEQNLAYRLSRVNPDSGKEQVIIASKQPTIAHPIHVSIQVPNATWTLSISPASGWRNWVLICASAVLSVLLALLLTAFIIYLRRREHEEKMEFMAYHDILTTLPNRVLLTDRFQMACARNKHSGASLALCFIDLDHFKSVNDTYSHEVGDRILVEVTQRIKTCIREEDTLSRHGGDEFILLLGDIQSQAVVLEIVERILEILAKPYPIDEYAVVSLSASIGVTFSSKVKNLDSLIQQADKAMYEAKLQGRNRYICDASYLG